MKTALISKNHGFCSILSIFLSVSLFPPACDAAPFAGGTGEPNDPYQVATAEDLASIGSDPNLLYKHFHFVLVADIDLAGQTWSKAVIPEFSGTFDGKGLAIRHLTITGEERYLGLFSQLFGEVRDLKVLDVNIIGSADGDFVGGLVGGNGGSVTNCFWDIYTSGQFTSALGIGLTTDQMQDPMSFLDAGWDFVGETANGSQDIWVMPANSYLRLAWEVVE